MIFTPMKKNILFLFLLFLLIQTTFAQYTYPQNSYPQNRNNSYSSSNNYQNLPAFRKAIGITFGTSILTGMRAFQNWSNAETNGYGMSSSAFFNIGIQAFVIKNHFVYGFAGNYEGLLSYSNWNPGRINMGIYLGGSLKDAYSPIQILTTVGIGYSSLTINLHGHELNYTNNIYNNSFYNYGNSAYNLYQNALYINPKVTFIKRINKLNLGLDASIGIYVPGALKYGYYYYTGTTYYNSSTHSYQRQKAFAGYNLTGNGVPNFDNISFTLCGFIGF